MWAKVQDPGSWIVRVALVLLLVSSSIRFFGDSSTTDTAATWLLIVSSAVGLSGIAAGVVTKQRRSTSAQRSDRSDDT